VNSQRGDHFGLDTDIDREVGDLDRAPGCLRFPVRRGGYSPVRRRYVSLSWTLILVFLVAHAGEASGQLAVSAGT
jgi:hypothetical protein